MHAHRPTPPHVAHCAFGSFHHHLGCHRPTWIAGSLTCSLSLPFTPLGVRRMRGRLGPQVPHRARRSRPTSSACSAPASTMDCAALAACVCLAGGCLICPASFWGSAIHSPPTQGSVEESASTADESNPQIVLCCLPASGRKALAQWARDTISDWPPTCAATGFEGARRAWCWQIGRLGGFEILTVDWSRS